MPTPAAAWPYQSLNSLLTDLLVVGGAPLADRLAAVTGVSSQSLRSLPFRPQASLSLSDADPDALAELLSLTSEDTDWLRVLLRSGTPVDDRLRQAARASVHPSHTLSFEAELLHRHIHRHPGFGGPQDPSAVALPLSTRELRRAFAELTLAGHLMETPDGRRPPAPLPARADPPPVLPPELQDLVLPDDPRPLPPPPTWRMPRPSPARTEHLSDGHLNVGDTLNVDLAADPDQEDWVVVLFEREGADWLVVFPKEPAHCVPWSRLPAHASQPRLRTLGINARDRTGPRRWAVGIVPPDLLDAAFFAGRPETLVEAIEAGAVAMQSFHAEVGAPDNANSGRERRGTNYT